MSATWQDVEQSSPEFAATARRMFDARRHKVLATLRKDGSPRISGTETVFMNGNIYLGMMDGSRKAMDLRRDPRLALHSGSTEPDTWTGDAKVSGRGEEVTDPAELEMFRREAAPGGGEEPPGPFLLFRILIDEVSTVELSEAKDHLVIQHWRGGELRRFART